MGAILVLNLLGVNKWGFTVRNWVANYSVAVSHRAATITLLRPLYESTYRSDYHRTLEQNAIFID